MTTNIGKNIRKTREDRGLTQKELSELTGISVIMLSQYENGKRKPKHDNLIKIASALSCSPTYLMGYDESNFGGGQGFGNGFGDGTGFGGGRGFGNGLIFNNMRYCHSYPIIGEVAAGYGSEAVEEETGDYEQIPADWLRGRNRDDFFVLRVKGNSMYPEYKDGDRVLVERKTSVDSGKVAVVLYDNEIATLKKVKYKYGEDWLELIPINPEYAPKRIENEDLEQCRVLGEAKTIIRHVK